MDTRVRLDNELVVRGMCRSRTEAKEIIERGYVFIDGTPCLKPSQKVQEHSKLHISQGKPFVSRGGEKLEGALLDIFYSSDKAREVIHGAVVLDIGSSTGGFTDCMIAYGAGHIDCVDVGTNQLHESLRKNTIVSVFENQDIRSFQKEKEYDFIVADLSFIALESVAKNLVLLGRKGTKYIILIKPQFEVGRGKTKKGIVKDKQLVAGVIQKIENIFKLLGLDTTHIFQSHVVGGDGNQEYFLYGIRT